MIMLNATMTLIWKDLKIEMRTKQMINPMIIFSLMVILSFKFATSVHPVELESVAPAILWITFTFAGMFGLSASFSKEKDRDSLSGLLLCPSDRSAIYLSKMISNLIVIFIIECAAIVFFVVFFSYDFNSSFLFFFLVMILGTLGYVIIGTLLSAISIHTKSREILLPILLIPLVIFTVIMPAITATGEIFIGSSITNIYDELQLLGMFNLIYFIVAMILFEYIIVE
jgi:heme exporter protein B